MIRRVLALLALGALLGVGRGAVGGLRPEITVLAVPDGMSVDDAILLDQGLKAGWLRTDPVIRRRLDANLAFAGQDGTEAERVEQGIALGMAQTDPVIRRRLIQRARLLLSQPAHQPRSAEAGPLELVEPVLSVRQVPLDADGEPRSLPALPSLLKGTEGQLATRLGWEAVEGIAALEVGEQATIRSGFGEHRVVLLDRALPASSERADLQAFHWDATSAFDARMASLREHYRVVRR